MTTIQTRKGSMELNKAPPKLFWASSERNIPSPICTFIVSVAKTSGVLTMCYRLCGQDQRRLDNVLENGNQRGVRDDGQALTIVQQTAE